MANLEDSESSTVEYLRKSLESHNVQEKSTAIATLSELSHDPKIVQDMIQGKLHINLLPLLDLKDSKNAKLSPPLINEVLEILNVLIRSYDIFPSSEDEIHDSFIHVMDLLKHASYSEVCQNNVYSLIETAGEYDSAIFPFIMNKLKMKLPTNNKAWNAFLSLFAHLSIPATKSIRDQITQSQLFQQISSIVKGEIATSDLAQIHCFEIIWNISKGTTQEWDCYNNLFCGFIEESLSDKRSDDIFDEIAQINKQITNDMEGKWANLNPKKANKGTNGVAAHAEDLEKWSKKENALSDRLHSIRHALDLYLQIFEHETEDEHKHNIYEDEQQTRNNYACILPKVSINKVVALLIEHWIDRDFDIANLVNISGSVGMDLYVADLLKTLKTKQINIICEIISSAMISISCSEWQCLWDVLLQRISDEMNVRTNTDDLDRDDGNISNILRIAISENHKELQITESNVDVLLKLHARVRNVQQLTTQFNIKNINGMDEFEKKDLYFVNDINAFQLHLDELFISLFKTEIIKTNKDYQRSILNALYDDVEMLCHNIQFVDILIEYQNGKRKKEVTEETDDVTFVELLEECVGSFQDALQIGFEIAQLILDVMSMNDEYAKLSVNKKRFGPILKSYKMVESKWLKCKAIIDLYNGNSNNNKEELLIDWEQIDSITQPVKECIVNIEEFIRY